MTNLPTLTELYASHRGKVSDKWSSYLPTYDRLFAGMRDRPINFLEIGVQNGGSLEIWAKYFPNAKNIIGIDINPKCADLKFEDHRIVVAIGDASKSESVVQPKSGYDIIIDDGSHAASDQIDALSTWWEYLNDGGIYVIEDMHCEGCERSASLFAELMAIPLANDRRHGSSNIARVEYLNSMAVIIKGDGSLGTRIIAGQIEAVAPGHLGMHGTYRHA